MTRTRARRAATLGLAVAAAAFLTACGGTPDVRTSKLLGDEVRFSECSERLVLTEPDPKQSGLRTALYPHDEADWHVQEKPDYCWAACMQTVMSLEQQSPIPTQPQLWERFVANPLFEENRDAATFDEILYALAPEYRQAMPGYFVIDTETPGLSDMVASLAAGEPVIVGVLDSSGNSGHAYVAYGLDFREAQDQSVSASQAKSWFDKAKDRLDDITSGKRADDDPLAAPRNNYEAVRFHLYDPDEPVPDAPDYGGGPKVFTYEQLKDRVGFAVSRSSARAFLEDRLRWLREHDDGPGIYLRNPIDPHGRPLSRLTTSDM